MNKSSQTTQDVISFISKSLSISVKNISENSSFFHDLGVDGDDAEEFINSFSGNFNISFDGFPFGEYFGAEISASPTSMIKEMLTKSNYKKFKRLEVRHLIEAVQNGKLELN